LTRNLPPTSRRGKPAPERKPSNQAAVVLPSLLGDLPQSREHATVAAGSTASYSVTLPSGATNVSAKCLNLPSGATCSYSSPALTITTSATTPKGTYPITVAFTETLPGAAAAFLVFPILLIPLVLLRKRMTARNTWLAVCAVLLLFVATVTTGCGTGKSPSPQPQTHTVTTSAAVTLVVQ
jgi:hypothetical protein